jgi:hypothetical protein
MFAGYMVTLIFDSSPEIQILDWVSLLVLVIF